MKYLQDVIRQQGKVLPGDILMIDSFLNHQIDVDIMNNIGKQFASDFKDCNADKILTIETSGVAIAQATSLNLNHQPVVYAKKDAHINMSNDCYECKEKSYTKGVDYNVKVAKNYLRKGEKILIIDDFLANGEALNSLLNICRKAEVEIVGVGIVVAKMYQPGYERITKEYGVDIDILAKVKQMHDDGTIEFEN